MTQEKIRELILDFLARHPISIEDFARTLEISPNTIRLFLKRKRKLQVSTWKKLDKFFEDMIKKT